MDDGDHGDHRDHGDSRADMGTTGTTLTVHVEEGLRRVLPGAAARPARVLPLVGGLHRPETQRPALHHRPRRQRACDDTAPCHPPSHHVPKPGAGVPPSPQHLPSHSRVGGGLPVPTQRNSAGCPGATLSCTGSTAAVGAAAVPAAVRPRVGGSGLTRGTPAPPPHHHGAIPRRWGQWEAGRSAWRGWHGGVRGGAVACSGCRGEPTPAPSRPATVTHPVCAPP